MEANVDRPRAERKVKGRLPRAIRRVPNRPTPRCSLHSPRVKMTSGSFSRRVAFRSSDARTNCP